ncbi:MAG: lactonase family protein [Myxococcales bacterium]|nr:lactonase family protein [Myxococcales bacterium]
MKNRPRRGLARRLLKVAFFAFLSFILILFGALLLFPHACETRLRELLFRHYIMRPAVLAGWGSLLTRAVPIDDEHLAVGLSTSVLALRKSGSTFEVCAQLSDIGIVHDLVFADGVLYAAAGIVNLAWYDWRDPCAPKKLGQTLFRGYGFGIQIRDGKLFLANREGGVAAFRLRSDGTPVLIGARYGNLNPFADEGSAWMTNDVATWGTGLVAADGNQGLVTFRPDGATGQDITTRFAAELTAPSRTRNIDPPPLRLLAYQDQLYVAMREKGVAVFHRKADGGVSLLSWARPDDGEVLDLEIDGSLLYIPSSHGKIYVYDLAADPIALTDPVRVYSLGEDKIILALAVRPPYVYAVSTGAGLFQFASDRTDPIASWRPPDELRGVALIDDYYVAALGNGGLAVYAESADGWRKVSAITLPSFVFDVMPLGDHLFAAAGDLSGTHIFSLGANGELREQLDIPTPEHVFATAFSPPDRLATANGVYGVLLYRFDPRADPPRFQPLPQPTPAPDLYGMGVNAWHEQFIGTNFSGPLQLLPVDGAVSAPSAPTRCLKGNTSPDGRLFALACGGDKIHLYSEPKTAPRLMIHSSDVLSLLPVDDLLLVGGFPDRLTVYRRTAEAFNRIADFRLAGFPYKITVDHDRFLIAAGAAGLYELTEKTGHWETRKISLPGFAASEGKAIR